MLDLLEQQRQETPHHIGRESSREAGAAIVCGNGGSVCNRRQRVLHRRAPGLGKNFVYQADAPADQSQFLMGPKTVVDG